MNLLYI